MEADIYSIHQESGEPLTLARELDLVKFKYRAIFNGPHSYYIIINKNFNVVDFNAASSKFIRAMSGKQICLGANICEYLKPETRDSVIQRCYNALKGEISLTECRISLFDRRFTWWSVEYSPAFDDAGLVEGVIFHLKSINERKIHESRIEMQSSKLRAISLMQSHDIRGPVCTIKGLLSLVREDHENTLPVYLPLIEQTINLLDERIKRIVECAVEG